METCDICGTLNFKENNYCTHCGNKLIVEHLCSHCGEPNPDNAVFCVKCGKQINPLFIDDFDILFSDYNKNLLENATISDYEYAELVEGIFIRANYMSVYGSTVKNKILNLAKVFTQCNTKARGYERGYIFLGNGIYYDDRLDDSVQISTIIHELAHYFLFTIVENLLCHIFMVKSSSTLQSFVWYFLTLPEFKIMNEYCAHTVEGRFVPYGYQNYGSFNILVKNTDFDNQTIDTMVVFGNSFANEIIVYLEKFISEELRQEIKIQYKKDLKSPTYESILTETNDSLPVYIKNSMLIKLLFDIFEEASKEEIIKELESIREGIELK